MMEKKKLLAGILVFGSLWGFSECIIGSYLRDLGLPAGILMTAIFALGLLTFSRIRYNQPGMQLGMGLVAGTLRLANPFGGCFLCSAIAIMAEGALFELLFYLLSPRIQEKYTKTLQLSMGIIISYSVYVGGYMVTQILTPFVSSAGFYVENLVVFIPQMLASGLLAALIGGITVPAVITISSLDLSLKDRLYYPTTVGVAVLCWCLVIANTLLILA